MQYRFLILSLLALHPLQTLFADRQVQVSPLFPCLDCVESPYGVCTHITRPGWDYEIRDKELSLCQKNGIRWVRSELDFSNYFSSLTKYDPTVFDGMLSSCEQQDCQLLGILTWFGRMPWDDPDYGRFVSLMAEKYRGRIRCWEALNEVNLMPEKDNLPEKYLRVLKTTYEALKQQDTANVVLTSGFAELRPEFLHPLFRMGAARWFDVFNFHSYLPPESLVPCFHTLHDLMHRYHWRKPVWITECGFHTARDQKNTDQFYYKMLPCALGDIGLHPNMVRIGVIRDSSTGYNALTDDECDKWLWWNKHITSVSLNALERLSPDSIPVLFTARDEYFPSSGLPALLRYVRRGGTLILAGGMPFYYDAALEGESMLGGRETGMKCYKAFHIAQGQGEEIPHKFGVTPHNRSTYLWHPDKDSPARYLTDDNLQSGDSLIPYVTAGSDPQHQLPIAGIYKFHSELKGRIIFQTRLYARTFPNREKEQARRVARLYLIALAHGVEKVFWYNLRSREDDPNYSEDCFGLVHHDFSAKPSLKAYRTLTALCPEGSTRPTLQMSGGVWHAHWITPTGRSVHALWNPTGKQEIHAEYPSSTRFFSHLGERLQPAEGKIPIGEGVIFVDGEITLR